MGSDGHKLAIVDWMIRALTLIVVITVVARTPNPSLDGPAAES